MVFKVRDSAILMYYSVFLGLSHVSVSHSSHFWLCVTLWTVACQVPLPMGFSRQEYWSGLPCPPPLPHVYMLLNFCLIFSLKKKTVNKYSAPSFWLKKILPLLSNLTIKGGHWWWGAGTREAGWSLSCIHRKRWTGRGLITFLWAQQTGSALCAREAHVLPSFFHCAYMESFHKHIPSPLRAKRSEGWGQGRTAVSTPSLFP